MFHGQVENLPSFFRIYKLSDKVITEECIRNSTETYQKKKFKKIKFSTKIWTHRTTINIIEKKVFIASGGE